MTNSKKILSMIPTENEIKQKFVSLSAKYGYSIDFSENDKISSESLIPYEIILGSPSPSLLSEAKNLKYLHLAQAGSNAYVAEGVLPKDTLLTNSTGAFGHAISEHMLGMLFELYKKLHLYRDNQNLCSWKDEGRVKSVKGSRCLVVGLGDIGSCFARSASALGIIVCGMRRTTAAQKPEYVENMYPFSSLNDIIGEFDIVALSLPETPETIKIINEKNIALMKDGSIILNVGRGSAIDTDALYNALISGKLGGAGIDVTDPEPLPPDHPLWKCKNAVITPHISGYFHLKETYDNIVNLAYDNLKAYLEGNTPANIVDFKTGYRKA